MNRRSVVLAAAAGVVLGSTVVLVPASASASGLAATASSATVCPGFVAHKGVTTPPENYTPNSILAQTLGIQDRRYVAVEGDAWPTSDGKFLMMHSPTVDSRTNGTGPISGHTLAYWQSGNILMDDGSIPMSLPQYLALFSKYKLNRGYLHVKSATALPYMARALNAAAVQSYVRVMASTTYRLRELYRLAPTYRREYITGPAIDTDTANQIYIAKRYGQKRIMIARPGDYVPTSRALRALFAAGLAVEWTTYNRTQDTVATQWNFRRVMTHYDVAELRALYPAGVCP